MKIKKVDVILFAWMIIVLVAIAWPSSDIPRIFNSKTNHQVAHIIMFGVLTFLINESLTARGLKQTFAAITGLLGASAYAGLSEVIQLFVPGRECSIEGIFVGIFGSIIALIVICFRNSIQKTRS